MSVIDVTKSQPANIETMHLKFREHCRGGGHAHIKVFAGTTPGSLGACGGLVMRTQEWVALRDVVVLGQGLGSRVVQVTIEEGAP